MAWGRENNDLGQAAAVGNGKRAWTETQGAGWPKRVLPACGERGADLPIPTPLPFPLLLHVCHDEGVLNPRLHCVYTFSREEHYFFNNVVTNGVFLLFHHLYSFQPGPKGLYWVLHYCYSDRIHSLILKNY